MASVWRRGRYFYVTYYDRSGRRITTSSHMTRRRDAEELAAGLEAKEILARRLGADAAAERTVGFDAVPIASLLDDWKKVIEARGNTVKHAYEQHYMARRLIGLAGAARIADMAPSAIRVALARLRDEEHLSLSTLNHYVRAVKGFSRWLLHDGRAKADALVGLTGYRAATDPRHPRRALSLPEIRRLLRAADNGARVLGVSGRDRGMLYRLMLGTGLRVGEVKTLRAKSFRFDEVPAVVVVEAAYSKHRREDHQPMRMELARMLRAWMKKRRLGPDDLVFPLPDKPNRMLHHDLAAANPPIPVLDAHRKWVDLHSLRHTFVTECVKHFPPKIAQQLARHANISLTMELYAHLETRAASDMLQEKPFYGSGPKTQGGEAG